MDILFIVSKAGLTKEYDFENEDKELKLVGLELMFLTPEKYSNPNGITAVELSKRVNLSLDVVKKKLKILIYGKN